MKDSPRSRATRRRLPGPLAGIVALAAAPWLALLLPLPDPEALGDPVAERYLPPASTVWCAATEQGGRACSPAPVESADFHPVRHWLGTDLFGRDLLSRLFAGARASVRAAAAALALTMAAGTAAGLAAALAPRADLLISFLSDLLLSVPRLFVILLAAALFQPGPLGSAALIAITSWMGVSRLVRAEARGLMKRDFVSAARASGAPARRLALAHLLPHLKGTLLAAAVLRMPDLLMLDAALGYLGLGAPPPAATLGGLMGGSGGSLRDGWWLGAFPGLWVVGTSLAFAALAERLRGRPDPSGSALL